MTITVIITTTDKNIKAHKGEKSFFPTAHSMSEYFEEVLSV